MSIVSFSEQLPRGVGEEIDELTVTFNRSLTSAEIASFSAALYVMDEDSGDEVDWTLSGGYVDYNLSRKGYYSISGSTLTINLVGEAQITGFLLDND